MQNRELKEFLDRFPEAFKITVNGADFSIKGDFALNGAELGGVINLVSSNTAAGETGVRRQSGVTGVCRAVRRHAVRPKLSPGGAAH